MSLSKLARVKVLLMAIFDKQTHPHAHKERKKDLKTGMVGDNTAKRREA